MRRLAMFGGALLGYLAGRWSLRRVDAWQRSRPSAAWRALEQAQLDGELPVYDADDLDVMYRGATAHRAGERYRLGG